MIKSQWSGGRVQVQVHVFASPAHLPLTSEAYSRVKSIIIEGRGAPRAAVRRMGAGSDGQFKTHGFPSPCQSVWAATGSVRRSSATLRGH